MTYLIMNEGTGNHIVWRTSIPCIATALRRGILNGRSASVSPSHRLSTEDVILDHYVYILDNDDATFRWVERATLTPIAEAALVKWRAIAAAQEQLYSYYDTTVSDNRFFPENITTSDIREILSDSTLLDRYSLGRTLSPVDCKNELSLLLANYKITATYSLGIYQKYVDIVNNIKQIDDLPALLWTAKGELTRART